MAKLQVEEQKEWSVFPPDSILHLKVDEIEEREIDGARGPWTKLNFKFKILGVIHVPDAQDGEYDDTIGEIIFGGVGARLTSAPENKLRLWAEAIMKVDLGVGDSLDTDLFLGREVRGITSQYNKKTNNPATGQPFKGHQIESLLPYGEALVSSGGNQGSQGGQQQDDPWGARGADSWGGSWGGSSGDEPPF